MRIDEADYYFARRSSSAWAKTAAAFSNISLARSNSTFSLESFQLAAFVDRQPRQLDGVALGLADPPTCTLRSGSPVSPRRTNGRPLRWMLGDVIEDDPDCALTQLRRVLSYDSVSALRASQSQACDGA